MGVFSRVVNENETLSRRVVRVAVGCESHINDHYKQSHDPVEHSRLWRVLEGEGAVS